MSKITIPVLCILILFGLLSTSGNAVLVASYGLNEGSGTTTADSSGNNTGALINGPVWTTGLNASYGNALISDGVNDFVNVSAAAGSLDIDAYPVTMEAWIKTSSNTTQQAIVARGNQGGDGYALWVNANGKINVGMMGGGNFDSVASISTNIWYHVAGIINSSGSKVYINGVDSTPGSVSVTVLPSSNNLGIGASNNGVLYFFNGTIDDVRIYNNALSQAQIQADMNTPIGGDTIPPSQVTGLVPVASSSSQVNLSWNAATDNVAVTGYKIRRCQGAGCTPTVNTANTTLTAYPDTGLLASTLYRYTVAAYDAAGNNGNQSTIVSITTLAASDTTPPSVFLMSPANGSVVNGVVAINANASDNVGVVGVQFKIDGSNIGSEDTIPPYNVSWNTSASINGTHSLAAFARDAAGNNATATITVNVQNAQPDTTPPNVTILSPPNGTIVVGFVTVNVSAVDNIGIDRVELYKDNIYFSNDTTVPYSFTWNTTIDANGPRAIKARAVDTSGNSMNSSIITIIVNNTAPDTVAPVLSSIQAVNITSNFAIISWTTNEIANSTVKYGLTPASLTFIATSASMVLTRSIPLSSLSALTTYFYNVSSCDPSGNCNTSSVRNFTTLTGGGSCSDGTNASTCSLSKPFFCNTGNLVVSCSSCGCPGNQVCNSTGQNCYVPGVPSYSNLNLTGKLRRTNFNFTCGSCSVTITIANLTKTVNANPAGHFSFVWQLSIAKGYYPAIISIFDGSNTTVFNRIVKVV